MLGQQFAVDKDLVVTKLDSLTRQPDHAFDIIYLVWNKRRIARPVLFRIDLIARVLKNNYIATFYGALRQKGQFIPTWGKDKLVHQQIVTYQDRVLHRAGRY